MRQLLLKLMKEKIRERNLSSPLKQLRKSQKFLLAKATKGRAG
jgi:hypothetical protein